MKEETKTDILKLVAFVIQKTKTEGDNAVVADFKQSVSNFDFEATVTDDEVITSSFDVLHDLTALTKWPGDEKIVNSLEMTYRTARQLEEITNSGNEGGWFGKLLQRFANRKNR